MWMQIVRWCLETDAGTAKAEPIDESAECLERIRGLGAAPPDDLIRQGVFDELGSVRQAREHDEEVGLRRQQEALECLIALGFRADQPVQRHRMDDEQPVQPCRADRLAGASVARGKLLGGEIVLGHQSAKRGMTFSPTISMERMIWSWVVWPIWNMKIIWSMPVAAQRST